MTAASGVTTGVCVRALAMYGAGSASLTLVAHCSMLGASKQGRSKSCRNRLQSVSHLCLTSSTQSGMPCLIMKSWSESPSTCLAEPKMARRCRMLHMKELGSFSSEPYRLDCIKLGGLHHDFPESQTMTDAEHATCMQNFAKAFTMPRRNTNAVTHGGNLETPVGQHGA